MFFNVLLSTSLFIVLVTTLFTQAESLSSTTETVEISTRATSGSGSNVTEDPEHEWRSNEDKQQNRKPVEKVVSIDSSSLNKYRRDGIENLAENDYRRRYFLDFPERYQYENELYHRDKNQNHQPQQYQQQQYQQKQYQTQYQQQQQQHRNRDETYPVMIQGCGHTMRDVFRPYMGNKPFQNQGVFQGWLAASGWHGSHANNDKRYEPSYPLQLTTATPKIVPNYHDKSGAPYKPRYDPQAGATRDYYNLGGRNIEHNPQFRMQSHPQQSQQYQNRNNRIVYYEYNLDDRRPSSGRCHPTDQNCSSANAQYDNRWHGNAGSNGHGSRFDTGHRFQTSDEYYYQNQQPHYRRSEGNRNEDSREPQIYDYLDEDSYWYRNDRRGVGHQNSGIGYVYSIDLPMERAISPSTAYAHDIGFRRKNQGYRHALMPHLDT